MAGAVADVAHELDLILTDHSISTSFQPIVDLLTGAVVGYEGLSRGPVESSLHMPTELFDAARANQRLNELDWLCRVAVLEHALAAGIHPPLTVFLNEEPDVLTAPPATAGRVLARAMGGLRVIVELTERALFAQPGALLRHVETLRRYGWGVAVDDIGAHPHSLAMLSVIEPDVVKLDQPALQQMPRTASAALVSGVQTYCRRSGARVVAEGLETDDDVDVARAVGAHYGQGWRFGHPEWLSVAPAPTAGPIPMVAPRPHLPTRRLIRLLTRTEPAQHGDQAQVDRFSSYLIEHAAQMGPNTLVIVCVQNAGFISAPIASTLQRAAEQVAYLAVLGAGVGPQPVPRARGCGLPGNDPLVSEWVVAAIGMQESIALVASDCGDDFVAGSHRGYDYAVTYDPRLVTDVARALLSRVT